jgi:trans-aconitate methyltransferase
MDAAWINAAAYEKFMGRWSAPIAREFLDWLEVPKDRIWLDVGCGTGALTKLILGKYEPKKIISIDSSGDFISYAQHSIRNPNVHFNVGLAEY